ncbi:hypothetical protein APHAL10511_008415 [Amanita phalloides]|nr:hypothetical protein APHAL10511_008415 [Amanita phalloides]
MLEMGPFHHKVYAHINITRDPALLIGSDASHERGTVNGLPWKSPEVINPIQKIKPDLPHLQPLLVKFFRGAAKGWKCFSSEFAPGGLIDEATVVEKDMAWLPTTNDVNEGALGSLQLTGLQYNAQAMFHHNETQAFMEAKFTVPENFKIMHQEAWKLKGVDKQREFETIQFAEEKIARKQKAAQEQQEKVAKSAAKIASITLLLHRDEVVKLAGEKLRDHFSAFKAAGAPNMQDLTKRSKISELRKALQDAVDMYHAGEWNPYKGQEEVNKEGEEIFDFTGIDEDEWEDLHTWHVTQ